MKLLIVEDERQLSDSIVSYLSQDDYRCEQAFTCGEALMRIGVYEYDCILGVDGVLGETRGRSYITYDSGADTYTVYFLYG